MASAALAAWARGLRALVPSATLFVVGNEAADADSIVSAIALAYARSSRHGEITRCKEPVCIELTTLL